MLSHLTSTGLLVLLVTVIGAVTVLESVALARGIDGTLLTLVIGGLFALGGVSLDRTLLKRSASTKRRV